jgi:hypothetical protein
MTSTITAPTEFSTERGLLHCGQNFAERYRGERCGVVGYPVGNNQLPAMHQTAAGVNHVWDIAFALVFVGFGQWLTQAGRARPFA